MIINGKLLTYYHLTSALPTPRQGRKRRKRKMFIERTSMFQKSAKFPQTPPPINIWRIYEAVSSSSPSTFRRLLLLISFFIFMKVTSYLYRVNFFFLGLIIKILFFSAWVWCLRVKIYKSNFYTFFVRVKFSTHTHRGERASFKNWTFGFICLFNRGARAHASRKVAASWVLKAFYP